MKFAPKAKIRLFKCRRCKKGFNNPFTHVCVIRLSKSTRKKTASRKTGGGKKTQPRKKK